MYSVADHVPRVVEAYIECIQQTPFIIMCECECAFDMRIDVWCDIRLCMCVPYIQIYRMCINIRAVIYLLYYIIIII